MLTGDWWEVSSNLYIGSHARFTIVRSLSPIFTPKCIKYKTTNVSNCPPFQLREPSQLRLNCIIDKAGPPRTSNNLQRPWRGRVVSGSLGDLVVWCGVVTNDVLLMITSFSVLWPVQLWETKNYHQYLKPRGELTSPHRLLTHTFLMTRKNGKLFSSGPAPAHRDIWRTELHKVW